MFLRSRRRAVTLTELAIVLAIILVVMALIFPMVIQTMWRLEDTKAIQEIQRMDQACEQFKAVFGRYPPGRIMLCEDMRGYKKAIEDHLCQDHFQQSDVDKYALSLLASKSMEYLQAIFPGINLNDGHDWNGDGVIDDRQYYLGGNEAMVFFLGGIRYGKGALDTAGSNRSAPTGFNTDKTHPALMNATTRLGPFFVFDESRITYHVSTGQLRPDYIPSPAGSSQGAVWEFDWTIGCASGLIRRPDEISIGFFSSYKDLWGKNYLYFNARNPTFNNYTYLHCPYSYQLGLPTSYDHNYHMWFADSTSIPDASTLPIRPHDPQKGPRSNPDDGSRSAIWLGFVPYIEQANNNNVIYYQRNRFQIISAGRDRDFGSGGFWIRDKARSELSPFKNYKFIVEENIPSGSEHIANFDNMSNINFDRMVPRP